MGKAAIYNPYLDTLGGGEKYTIEFAKVLADLGFDVDIEWSDPEVLGKLSTRFGIKLPKNIKVVSDIKRGLDYEICFWVSDGSIPMMRARKNIIHFQVPFNDVDGKSLLNKMKLFRVNKIVCNSEFTKKNIDKEFGVDSIVIYPPIENELFKPKRKENIILYVGRFSNLLQSKRQDILINSFKVLYDSGLKDWKLILAGGSEVGSNTNIVKLKEIIDDYPIEIIESPSFTKLQDLYGKSKIFWSASGYNVDEEKNPKNVEHFGMTVVEAMSAGSVPLVVNKGGHGEIISSGKNGFLWHNEMELIELTKDLIKTKGLIKKLSDSAKLDSIKFSKKEFKENVCKKII